MTTDNELIDYDDCALWMYTQQTGRWKLTKHVKQPIDSERLDRACDEFVYWYNREPDLGDYAAPFDDAESLAACLLSPDDAGTDIAKLLLGAVKHGPDSAQYEDAATLLSYEYVPPEGWTFTVYDVVDEAMNMLIRRGSWRDAADSGDSEAA